MIIEYIRCTIRPDKAADLMAAYAKAGESLQACSHCLGYELAQCMEAQESFILRISWDSLVGHLKGFRESPEFTSYFTALLPHLGNISEMRHYQVTAIRWTKSEPCGEENG